MNKLALLVISSIAAVGCATSERYTFRPMGPTQAGEAGFPASRYQIPPDAPRGEAFVTSFGTRETDGGDGARSQLIHVRLAVANQSGEASWSLDPAQQTLAAAGTAPQSPDFMEIDGKQGTTTEIARGQRRVFDLYYRVPGGTAAALSGFDFNWQVNTGAQAIAERTAFARDAYREYPYAYGPRSHVAVGIGVAGPWWAYGYGPGWGPYAYGVWGPWGYPYYYGGYYGGWGRGYYGGGYRGWGGGYGIGRGHYGGGFGGGFSGGGSFGRGGGGMQAPVTRGRPGN